MCSCCLEETHAGVIYGLHTGDYDFRYIGKTEHPLAKRLAEHRKWAGFGTTSVYQWMRKYGAENIQACIIETFTSEDVHLINERERFHIAQQRAGYGKENLNLTDGGDGAMGYRHTEEAKAQMSLTRTGRTLSEETRAKLSLAGLGRTVSGETRARISAAKKGTVVSEETKAKLAAANLGKTYGPETKAKLSLAFKGRVLSEEHKERISASNRGKTRSAETRAKLSENAKNQIRTPESNAKRSATQTGRPHRGSHTRWHTKMDKVDPACRWCQEALSDTLA